ncbi:MAG TPA: hypothetical protein VNR60_08510 [Croceibacterium sp.]|nr:hypothetical protein [Croceibacterium sp.]
MKNLALIALAPLSLGLITTPAAAQEAGNEKVNIVDVFGEDACPPSTDDVIVVCRRMDEGERYRIPEALRQSNSPQNDSWTNRVKSFETVGNFGPLSCSPVGMGGELGCTAEMIAAAYEERRTGSGVRASEIISAQRTERLSTIDAEAAATQARVEELERQYMERVAREEGQATTPSTTPQVPKTVDPLAIPPSP